MQLLTLLEAPGTRRMQYAELLPALLECTPATAPWAAERAVVVSLFERRVSLQFKLEFDRAML